MDNYHNQTLVTETPDQRERARLSRIAAADVMASPCSIGVQLLAPR